MKKPLALMAVLLLTAPLALGATGFTTQQSLYYTGDSSTPNQYYKDSTPSKGNNDIGVELCGAGPSNYVGAFYALEVSGTWYSVLVSYDPSVQALVQTGATDVGGGCYQTTAGGIVISPSQFTGSPPDPDVQRSAFPGKMWIGYDGSSANPGTVSDFIFADTNARLLGGYGYSSGTASADLGPTRTFDQSGLSVQVSAPYIYFDTTGSDPTKVATDSTHGVSTDRRMVMGLCDDALPAAEATTQTCFDALVVDAAGDFPATFSTGLGSVNDQSVTTRNVIINGFDYEMCIGANLQASIQSVSPNPVYYSQNLTITVAATNPRDTPTELDGGNVDVTTDFNVRVRIYPQGVPGDLKLDTTFQINDTIVPDGTAAYSLQWPAFGLSGTYVVRVDVDTDNDVNECDETDNDATATFELKPITIPDIYIDGTLRNTFPYPNVPYNFSIYLKNSDNDTLANATVYIVEENGLSLLGPTQVFNRDIGGGATTPDGLRMRTRLHFTTDNNGNASFTIIPTYNRLYLPQYNYTNLSQYIGNYSLVLNGEQSNGESFKFVTDGSLYDNLTLGFDNLSYTGPYTAKDLPNETIVSQVLDFIYQTFNTFLEVVRG